MDAVNVCGRSAFGLCDVIQACRLHMQSLTCSETMTQYLLCFLVLISSYSIVIYSKVIYHRESPIITPSSNSYSKGKIMSQLFMRKQLCLLDQILIHLQKREADLLLK